MVDLLILTGPLAKSLGPPINFFDKNLLIYSSQKTSLVSTALLSRQ